MGAQTIEGENYQVNFQPESATVEFIGSLRLSGPKEYAPIAEILSQLIEPAPSEVILDLSKLQFLNSSGISMISKFVINLRKAKTISATVIGSQDIPWQGKSLKNLQKLLPGLRLDLR
ncbi:MAG: hypothetical protein AAGG02_06155 [Cyanobacteria bacterium P01_H01_bin.15]